MNSPTSENRNTETRQRRAAVAADSRLQPNLASEHMPTLAALRPVQKVEAQLDRDLRPAVKRTIEALLLNLSSAGAIPEGAAPDLAARLQRLLDHWGFRVVCPKCHEPAKLYGRPGRTGKGVFEFVHTEGRKIIRHGGGQILPPLTLAKFPE